ncbi:MAG: InlB B-repeat-containing protein [Oscillospiraceae bacterium]|nr:InlB B-repeat-containing protein [Oscillospiraceae bacterium]
MKRLLSVVLSVLLLMGLLLPAGVAAEAVSYTVSYNALGSGAPEAQIKLHDVPLTLSDEEPVFEGWIFLGWGVNSWGPVAYQPGDTYTANSAVVLHAIWAKAPPTYPITYDAMGGTGAPAPQTKAQDVPLQLSDEIPEREGHRFLYWRNNLRPNMSYQPGDIYTDNASLQLQAVWQALYTVFFDANGGVDAPEPQVLIQNTSQQLSDETPSREGYLFLGWSFYDTSQLPMLSPGGSLNRNTDLLLYAVWAPENVPDEGFTPIYTPEDLDNIRNNPSVKFILMNDIDLAEWGDWEPIGGLSFYDYAQYRLSSGLPGTLKAFSGVLDGNGYVIKNLNVRHSAFSVWSYSGWLLIIISPQRIVSAGLFTSISNAEIKNLGIEQANVLAEYTDPRPDSFGPDLTAAGGIAGFAHNSKITDCYVRGTVHAYNAVGGIVGFAEGGSVTNCYTALDPFEPTGRSGGGIQGVMHNFYPESTSTATSVTNCYSLQEPIGNNLYALPIDATNCAVLSDEEMLQQASFPGFDFDTPIWYIQEGVSYPQLRPFITDNTDIEDLEDLNDPEEPEQVDPEVPEDVSWWSSLPSWLQWVLRWLFFGWIWM